MKFSDMIKSILIILVFVLLYFSAILIVGLKKMKEDWPKYRCSPTMMPFASYLGYDTMANFTHCVGNIQKDMMGFFLQPIQYVLGMVMGMIGWILERIQFIRVFIDKFFTVALVSKVFAARIYYAVNFRLISVNFGR